MDAKSVAKIDWRKSKDVKSGHFRRSEHVLKSGLWSDVSFLLGQEKKEFKVHKLVLRTGSSVFDELFNGNKDKDSFEVPDLEPNEFELLLQFLYTGKCTDNVENGLALLKAATKYDVSDLIHACGKLVGGNLTEKNALKVFQEALKYKNVDLTERALKCLGSFARKLLQSPEFLELSIEELTKIVASDALEIPNEVDLFEAVMDWARAECKRQKSLETPKYMRSMLENVIPLIRFPLMDSTDFALKVSPTNVLLMEEIVSILMYFSVKQEDRGSIPPGIFNTKSRAVYSPTGSKFVMKRLVQSATPVMDLSTGSSTGKSYITASSLEHSIRLKSNTSIWITSIGVNTTFTPIISNTRTCNTCATEGISFYRSQQYLANASTCSAGHELTPHEAVSSNGVSVKTQVKVDNKTLGTTIVRCYRAANQVDDIRHIHFDKPVYIRKKEWYTLSFAVTSGDLYANQYIAQNGAGTSLDFKLPNGSVVNFEFCNENNTKYTGVTQGFIPEIGFMVE